MRTVKRNTQNLRPPTRTAKKSVLAHCPPGRTEKQSIIIRRKKGISFLEIPFDIIS